MLSLARYTRHLQFARRDLRSISRTTYASFSHRGRQLSSNLNGSKAEDEDDNHKQKPKGSYTRVFAGFAVGIPIGWAVSAYSDDGKGVRTVKPGDFVKYALVKKEDVSSTCSIFTLKPAANAEIDAELLHDRRAITSVQFKQPQLQIARSYTVLPPVDGQDPQELRFLIRKEHNGEVSGYLHRLALGAELELRGPSVDFVLPEHVKHAVFLAGGTGIAPAMQVADKLGEEANMHILWASRRTEDCEGGASDTRATKAVSSWDFSGWWSPFGLPSSDLGRRASTPKAEPNVVVAQIDAMKRRCGNTMVDYYVDEEGTFIRLADVTKLLTVATESTGDNEPTGRLLFVSGPEGFVSHWAGPKQWANGREVQGPLGGILSTLDLRGWQVVKL